MSGIDPLASCSSATKSRARKPSNEGSSCNTKGSALQSKLGYHLVSTCNDNYRGGIWHPSKKAETVKEPHGLAMQGKPSPHSPTLHNTAKFFNAFGNCVEAETAAIEALETNQGRVFEWHNDVLGFNCTLRIGEWWCEYTERGTRTLGCSDGIKIRETCLQCPR